MNENSRLTNLQVMVVTSDAQFAALEHAWNAVARHTVTPSVFLSHEWFTAAWAWRRLDSTLHTLAARDGERVVGLLPLISVQQPASASRSLEMLTVPDTQLCDLIAAPGDLDAVAEAFAAALAAQRDWDTLKLDHLMPHGASIRALAPAIARHGLRIDEQDGGRNAFVALNGAWNDYYNGRSRSLKKANNLAANRLKKAGEIRIEWLSASAGDEARFERALDTVIDISRRSWKRETGNALDQPGPQAFIRSLSRAAYAQGWLSLWLIYLDEQPLAMEYQLIYGSEVHALRADFDTQREEISPGSHLFRQLLERLFEHGLGRYYMGRGDNPYKKRWTDEGEPLRRMMVYHRTLRGQFAWLREVVLAPVVRTMRDRMMSLKKRARAVDAPPDNNAAP
ncbi:MAG TPA: GNAT family N-acetyltransferase [Burkholderiales bacterium]|nr:GNAT family N-acetyltransferase [Burkholderiales bacterium]